jgi:hypothetical protein
MGDHGSSTDASTGPRTILLIHGLWVTPRKELRSAFPLAAVVSDRPAAGGC